jgi:hypothetical protein
MLYAVIYSIWLSFIRTNVITGIYDSASTTLSTLLLINHFLFYFIL